MSPIDRRPVQRLRLPRLIRGGGRHEWSQQHLSHYVEGDLNWLARRRIELPPPTTNGTPVGEGDRSIPKENVEC